LANCGFEKKFFLFYFIIMSKNKKAPYQFILCDKLAQHVFKLLLEVNDLLSGARSRGRLCDR